jgi:hypothetical protein
MSRTGGFSRHPISLGQVMQDLRVRVLLDDGRGEAVDGVARTAEFFEGDASQQDDLASLLWRELLWVQRLERRQRSPRLPFLLVDLCCRNLRCRNGLIDVQRPVVMLQGEVISA